MQRFLRLTTATLILGLCAAACGDDDSSAPMDACAPGCGADGGADAGSGGGKIEVAGDWDNQFGMEELITDTMWGDFKLIEFDNGKNIAITQNAADDMFNPSKFNQTVWLEPKAGGFSYCMFAFGKDTAAEAKKAENTADDSDLKKGCGGFEWTKLTPHVAGSETDAGNETDAGK